MPTLPMGPATSWMDSIEGTAPDPFGRDDYELYEEDGEFVLAVDVPGFEREDVDLRWDDGRLHIAAERDGEHGGRTYYRSFRFPKAIDADGIAAEYRNGVVEVTLPIEGASVSGTEIEVA